MGAIKCYLNGTCVESNYNNQQASNLTNILTKSNTLIKERGMVQGAYPITENSLLIEVTAGHVNKPGITTRVEFSKAETVHIKGKLQLDLSTCDKYLVDGVRSKIVLEPGTTSFLIKSPPPAGGAQAYDYLLKSVKLTCTKVKPSDGALLATQKIIVKEPFEYLMRRIIIHREVIPEGYSDYTATRPFQSLIPNKLYIFLVDCDGAMGHQLRPPFYYDHYDLKHYSVKINGFQVAGGPMDSDYKGEYLDLLQAHAGDYFIPFENYTKGCFVLCINTNDQSQFNSINIEKSGNLSISLTFGRPLARPTLLHIAGAIDSPFTVDLDRIIHTDFQH